MCRGIDFTSHSCSSKVVSADLCLELALIIVLSSIWAHAWRFSSAAAFRVTLSDVGHVWRKILGCAFVLDLSATMRMDVPVIGSLGHDYDTGVLCVAFPRWCEFSV